MKPTILSQALPNRPAFGAIYPNDAQSLGEPSRHVLTPWIRLDNYTAHA